MKILIFSDLHGEPPPLLEEEPDMVFLLGDIPWRDVKKIDRHYTCPKLGVLGNHDPLDTYQGTSVVHVHQTCITVKGLTIAGFDGCPRYNEKTHSPQYDEGDVTRFTETLDDVDIFLAHSNPRIKDSRATRDSHRGFFAYTTMIEEGRVGVFCHGHTHENAIVQHGNTYVVTTYGMRWITL